MAEGLGNPRGETGEFSQESADICKCGTKSLITALGGQQQLEITLQVSTRARYNKGSQFTTRGEGTIYSALAAVNKRISEHGTNVTL